MAISFFAEGIKFRLPRPRSTASWIRDAIKKEKRRLNSLTIIFCPDAYLLKLNIQYLKHKTLTDILTFNFAEDEKSIQGEVYISIDRVRENAARYDKSLDEEVHRVIIHGILHLIGYDDKTATDKALMREKEEAYLSLR
jgi:rRNA maturation RNase YbeY